jgi:hypothetical protein
MFVIDDKLKINYTNSYFHECSISSSSQYGLFFLICAVGLWVLRPLTGLLYQPRMIGDSDCGEIGRMKIGMRNRSTRRKPAPAPFRPPQIPHDYTRVWTRAAAVGSQWLTAWAMARPSTILVRRLLFACLSFPALAIFVTFDLQLLIFFITKIKSQYRNS